jgi:PhnB protein
MRLSNYLFFTTTCEESLAFCTRRGLGRVAEVMRQGANGMPSRNEAMHGKIMHARSRGASVLFCASDNDDAKSMRRSAHVLIMRDREQTEELFKRLGEGGRITAALGMQPWGDCYGKLTTGAGCSGWSTAPDDRLCNGYTHGGIAVDGSKFGGEPIADRRPQILRFAAHSI